MKIISTNQFYYKKLLPFFWFGFLAFFLFTSVSTKAYEKNIIFILMPVLIATIGYLVFKKLIWNLIDEVYDCGDFLLLKKDGKEDKILLSNIMNISGVTISNPPRATLTLVKPCQFGKEVTFMPLSPNFRFNPFAKNAVVEDLIVRIDAARLNRKI